MQRSEGYNDWSFMPFLDYINASKLIKIDNNCLCFEGASEGTSRVIDQIFHDHNWIEAEVYEKTARAVIKKASSEERNNILGNQTREAEFFTMPSTLFHSFNYQESVYSEKMRETKGPSDEEWLKKFLSTKSETGFKDYSYKTSLNDKSAAKSNFAAGCANFQSSDPRKILGLGSKEKDINVITKQFRKLALIYHPDKPYGNKEIFQKISSAYKSLLKEFEDNVFETNMDISQFENFLMANQHYIKLMSLQGDIDTRIAAFKVFSFELEKLQGPEFSGLSISLKMLLKQVKNNQSQLEIERDVNIVQLPSPLAPIEERIKVLNKLIIDLDSLFLKYDLKNEKKTWSIATTDLYEKSFYLLMDKRIALSRSLAELYAEDKKDLLNFRKNTLAFYQELSPYLVLGPLASLTEFLVSNLKMHDFSKEEEVCKPKTPKTEDRSDKSFEFKDDVVGDGSTNNLNENLNSKDLSFPLDDFDTEQTPLIDEIVDQLKINIQSNIGIFQA